MMIVGHLVGRQIGLEGTEGWLDWKVGRLEGRKADWWRQVQYILDQVMLHFPTVLGPRPAPCSASGSVRPILHYPQEADSIFQAVGQVMCVRKYKKTLNKQWPTIQLG